MAVQRQTVDLSAYPDLVVIYLGMRVRRPRGMLYCSGWDRRSGSRGRSNRMAFYLHEDLIWSLVPPTWDAPVLA